MHPQIHAAFDIPVPLDASLKKQEELFSRSSRECGEHFILFAEHEPVYTFVQGKMPNSRLFRNGGGPSSLRAPLVPLRRPGSITYHGPGQLVCYFIFDLKTAQIGVFDFNDAIEMSVIEMLASFNIQGTPKPAHLPQEASGVWVKRSDGIARKIASRGLHYSPEHGSTRFGCGINLSTDLSWFDPIFPCGLDIQMTSVEKEASVVPSVRSAAHLLFKFFCENFNHFFQKEKRRSN